MRAVVQRVSQARIEVAGELVSEMREGLLALVGVARSDAEEDARELARKLVQLRIFEGESGRMDRSLLDTGASLAVVSQFTLLGDARKGRRPSYGDAAAPERAESLIELLVECARGHGAVVATGRFRAMMDVSLVNRGPVTILLDTQKHF